MNKPAFEHIDQHDLDQVVGGLVGLRQAPRLKLPPPYEGPGLRTAPHVEHGPEVYVPGLRRAPSLFDVPAGTAGRIIGLTPGGK